MSMAAAISGDDAKVFHWSEDPRAITCITLDGVASDERRRAYLRRRASVPWRGTSMDGVHVGASRAVLQSMIAGIAGGACASLQSKMLQSMIDGIAGGACASLQPKMASSLGNCCSVGVTTAAGRVAGGVFMLCVERGSMKLSTRDSASSSPLPNQAARVLLPTHVYASSGVPRPLVGARDGLSR